MLVQTLFPQCQVAFTRQALIEFGRERNWYFASMAEKGVIDKPMFTGDWFFVPDHLDSTTLPEDAQARLDAVAMYFPIAQVIIGHEVKVSEEAKAPDEIKTTQETPEWEIMLPDIPWGGIAKVALGVVAGAGLLLGYAAIATLGAITMVDPKLIVCLEEPGLDPSEYPWICLLSWEE